MSRWPAMLLLFSGCSFALDGPKSDRPRNTSPRCDTGKTAVVLDFVMAGALGTAAMVSEGEIGTAALVPAAIGAVYLTGGLVGNSRVNKCRAAVAEYEAGAGPVPPSDIDDQPSPSRVAGRGPPGLTEPTPASPAAPSSEAVAPAAAKSAAVAPAPAKSAAVAPAAVAPGAAAPAPAASAPATPAPVGPGKAPPARPGPQPHDDEWSEFWREVSP